MSGSDDLDLDSRRLCPDGACIGVLGANGHCGVCGLADDGSVSPGRSNDFDEAPDDAEAAVAAGDNDETATTDAFDDDRRLCPDGTCIGVLGADGRCRVCGARGS